MDCPICKSEMKRNEELSRGMGNQEFQECPHCGTVVLRSGDILTQIWAAETVQKGVENAVRPIR